MTPESSTPGLDSEQFAEMMELIKGSKSVELKLTVPAESNRVGGRGARSRSARRRRSAWSPSSTRPTSTSTRPASWCAPAGSRARAPTPS